MPLFKIGANNFTASKKQVSEEQKKLVL